LLSDGVTGRTTWFIISEYGNVDSLARLVAADPFSDSICRQIVVLGLSLFSNSHRFEQTLPVSSSEQSVFDEQPNSPWTGRFCFDNFSR